MPLTAGETAFAYAMQHEGAKREIEQRLLMIERALLALAVERQKAGETIPKALGTLAFKLERRGLRA